MDLGIIAILLVSFLNFAYPSQEPQISLSEKKFFNNLNELKFKFKRVKT